MQTDFLFDIDALLAAKCKSLRRVLFFEMFDVKPDIFVDSLINFALAFISLRAEVHNDRG